MAERLWVLWASYVIMCVSITMPCIVRFYANNRVGQSPAFITSQYRIPPIWPMVVVVKYYAYSPHEVAIFGVIRLALGGLRDAYSRFSRSQFANACACAAIATF